MASPNRVSWTRLVNFEHPNVDFVIQGLSNALTYFAIHSWTTPPLLRALPLAVCGLFWPESSTARTVTGWIQAASVVWVGRIAWSEADILMPFGNDPLNTAHGPLVHVSVPIGLVCALNVAIYQLAKLFESIVMRMTLWGLQFRGRALLYLGSVFAAAVLTAPFMLPSCLDPRNPAGRVLSDLVRRFVVGPRLRRTKKRREALSTAFLGQGRQGFPGVSYTYSSLRSGNRIRLLEMVVDSSRKPAAASVDLVDFDLSSAPPYEALSYCWGDATETHHILLGHTLPTPLGITKSAYDALCAVTPLQGTKYVWIDSVCINQEAELEKQHQLPIMGDIYQGASLVTAHIPCRGDTAYAGLWVSCLAWSYSCGHFPAESETNTWHWQQSMMFSPDNLPFPRDNPGWQSLTDLIRNPIWGRAWIIQEVALARRWRLLYGDACMSLDALSWASNVYQAWEAGLEMRPKGLVSFRGDSERDCIRLYQEQRWRALIDGGRRPSLAENVIRFVSSESTEPEDKVHALLGISSGQGADFLKQKLQHDGPMTTRQLYTLIVQQALEAGSFRTFSISGTSQHSLMGLPSWVPDFSSVCTVVDTSTYHLSEQFSAGSSLQADYAISPDGSELRMRGVLLDHIHATSLSAMEPPAPDSVLSGRHAVDAARGAVDLGSAEFMARIFQSLLGPAHLVRHYIPDLYMDDTDPLEALCRTVLQNMDPREMEALDDSSLPGAKEALASMISVAEKAVEEGYDEQAVRDGTQGALEVGQMPEETRLLCHFLSFALIYRQVAVTQKGYLASVPWGTKEGDAVCVFQGSPVPCVLRPVGNGDEDKRYLFHGEAYVQGWMMQSKAMELEKTWFTMI
ncbi:hypothetical protein NEMBOFW57_000985 [Staphylotrichum longicolle]|uniref:Heterokaryon incompatibility domain-containing protein n=1 Tax=Staphylotrichum longicolle TaxID=669026 RepID=A0AAD4F568_9PEZI|nr:hypothetical protein NEMBOFW57_000985 [Staphylotrichum longicolle]